MTEPLVLLPTRVTHSRLVRPVDDGVHCLSGATMGTTWSLTIVGAIDPHALTACVQAELDAVVDEMSQWAAHSELSLFNTAEPGCWRQVSPGFFYVLQQGVDIARRTRGAFDPTLGAIVDLWGFGPVAPEMLPPQADALATALRDSGWQRLTLDASTRRVRQPGGLKLDLSGTAKGHGVDRVVQSLEHAGHVSFLMEIGGELVGRGIKPDGQPWWVDLESPLGADAAPIRIGLLDSAIATSGDYRRFHDVGAERLAHTLDPRTGAPLLDPPASVTVLHPECAIADALATAVTVLGTDAGLALADEERVAAILFDRRRGAWLFSACARAMADA